MTRRILIATTGAALLAAACQPPSSPPGDVQTAETRPAQDRAAEPDMADTPQERAARRAEAAGEAGPRIGANANGPLDGPLTDGAWTYKDMQAGPAALFGAPETEARFAIRCDASGNRILFEPAGTIDKERQVLMTLTTPAQTRRFYVRETDGELPVLRAGVRASDSGLQRLAKSDGPIAMSLEGRDTVLRMPADPAIGRVIDQCRNS